MQFIKNCLKKIDKLSFPTTLLLMDNTSIFYTINLKNIELFMRLVHGSEFPEMILSYVYAAKKDYLENYSL